MLHYLTDYITLIYSPSILYTIERQKNRVWGEPRTILMSKPTKRYTLNTNQIQLLKIIYKFRFITNNFLASYKNISHVASHKSLEVLKDQEYLGSHYSSSYKLHGKGARYYLAPKGLKLLRDNFQLNEHVLHSMYKNKTVTEGFVDHQVDVTSAYLHISNSYHKIFDIFARTELGSFDTFPESRPDLFLNRIKESDPKTNQYFIELWHDKPPISARKRLSELLEHYDDGEWEEDTYPTLCFVLADARAEDGFVEYATKTLDATGMEDEITILTTSKKAISTPNRTIWSSVVEPGKLISLDNL